VYAHPYPGVRRYAADPARVEHHELIQRSAREREAPYAGRPHEKEHIVARNRGSRCSSSS
jgi:hypothetical protein